MDHAQRFREAAHRHNHRRARTGWRYPEEIRALAVAYCVEQRRDRRPWVALSQELGVSTLTLTQWFQAAQNGHGEDGGFREVLVTAAEAEVDGRITLITPDGFRIEGLEASAIPELLRRLR